MPKLCIQMQVAATMDILPWLCLMLIAWPLLDKCSLSPSTLETCLFMQLEQPALKSQKPTGKNMMPIWQPTCSAKKLRLPYGNKFDRHQQYVLSCFGT
jgi:hypothetical protein